MSGLLSGSQVGFAFALGGEGTRMPASIVQHYADIGRSHLIMHNIESPLLVQMWLGGLFIIMC